MNELTQALLNTCVVSDEAKRKLESIFSNQGTAPQLIELTYNSNNTTLNVTFNELCSLLQNNYWPYFEYLEDRYYCIDLLQTGDNLFAANFVSLFKEGVYFFFQIDDANSYFHLTE